MSAAKVRDTIPAMCPGCNRNGAACWASPCLYLSFVLSRPLPELKAWARHVGGTLKGRA